MPRGREFSIDRAALTRGNGLHLPDDLPISTWQRIGDHLFRISDAMGWWMGDWLIFGERAYGSRYREALARTSLDYKTLRNYAWVARGFPVARRRTELSFAHHAEVVPLPPDEQDFWLDLAEKGRWSRNELRRRMRHSRSAALPSGTAAPAPVAPSGGLAAPSVSVPSGGGAVADPAFDAPGRPAAVDSGGVGAGGVGAGGVGTGTADTAPGLARTVRVRVPAERERRWQQAARTMRRDFDEWVVAALDGASEAALTRDT
ncbi:LmbU family transcriptional regulator [Nocardiopsis mangrovi]|uniref:LmbU family transcriptional regulator n=1 Tax=Nocardiopsis mangrovi TaxID=1179818 RepID=A0ABV9DV44_9ACTN